VSRFEYRVSYRRRGNRVVQKQVFRQEPAALRFIAKLADPKGRTSMGALLPLEGFAIDKRPVGTWERIHQQGEL
jgi:hypothetical protein